jgi:hypothetical protein
MRKQQIGWKRERDSTRERERERERKEQIRSQDLKLAGVRWRHYRPEFLAGAALLLEHWSLTFDRVTDLLIFNMDCVSNGLCSGSPTVP